MNRYLSYIKRIPLNRDLPYNENTNESLLATQWG